VTATLPNGPIRTRAEGRAMSLRAHAVRGQRRELREQLGAGTVHPASVILEPPTWAEGMRVDAVLLSAKRIYRVKAKRAMNAAGIHPRATLGDLTDRQRLALLSYLREKHPGIWALWNTMARSRL
jgi:hypothetical protein